MFLVRYCWTIIRPKTTKNGFAIKDPNDSSAISWRQTNQLNDTLYFEAHPRI